MAKAPNYDSEVLRRIKDRRDPTQTAKTQTRMLIAAKIYEQMQKQGVSKSQLANLLGQRPSVVTKWLSGTHNFTIDTLVDVGRVLNFDLLNQEDAQQPNTLLHIEVSFSVNIEKNSYSPMRVFNSPQSTVNYMPHQVYYA